MCPTFIDEGKKLHKITLSFNVVSFLRLLTFRTIKLERFFVGKPFQVWYLYCRNIGASLFVVNVINDDTTASTAGACTIKLFTDIIVAAT